MIKQKHFSFFKTRLFVYNQTNKQNEQTDEKSANTNIATTQKIIINKNCPLSRNLMQDQGNKTIVMRQIDIVMSITCFNVKITQQVISFKKSFLKYIVFKTDRNIWIQKQNLTSQRSTNVCCICISGQCWHKNINCTHSNSARSR